MSNKFLLFLRLYSGMYTISQNGAEGRSLQCDSGSCGNFLFGVGCLVVGVGEGGVGTMCSFRMCLSITLDKIEYKLLILVTSKEIYRIRIVHIELELVWIQRGIFSHAYILSIFLCKSLHCKPHQLQNREYKCDLLELPHKTKF